MAVLKPVSAAISIGTGGPFGAEGPIIMTGGALGSILAQYLRPDRRRAQDALVAGAAAGMAATFNAPLASVLLAVELLLFEWRPRSFVPVVGRGRVATLAARAAARARRRSSRSTPRTLHIGPAPRCCASSPARLGGLLAVVVDRARSTSPRTRFLRCARRHRTGCGGRRSAGSIIGLGGLVEPRALGVGYDVIDELLDRPGRAVADRRNPRGQER